MNLSDWLSYRRERQTYVAHRQLLRPFPPAREIKTPEQLVAEFEAAQQHQAALANCITQRMFGTVAAQHQYAVYAQNAYRPDTVHQTPYGRLHDVASSDTFGMLGRLIGWK